MECTRHVASCWTRFFFSKIGQWKEWIGIANAIDESNGNQWMPIYANLESIGIGMDKTVKPML